MHLYLLSLSRLVSSVSLWTELIAVFLWTRTFYGMSSYVLVNQQVPAQYVAVVLDRHDLHPSVGYTGRTHLRSAVKLCCDLVVPRTRFARRGPRGFALSGSVTWNSLPPDIREFPKPTQD